MRVLFSLICESATTRPDGRVDAHGVFHELYAPGFPAAQDRMVLATRVEWGPDEAGDQEFQIDLLDPSGSPTFTISGATNVWAWNGEGIPPRSDLFFTLPDVRFPVAGSYLFQLRVGVATVALAPIQLLEDPDAV